MTCPVVRPAGSGSRPSSPELRTDDRLRLPPASFSVALVGDWQVVREGLAPMLEPFAPRVRVVVPDDRPPAEGSGPADHACAIVPDILLVDCYRRAPEDDVLVGHPAPPAPAGVRVVAYSWWLREDLAEAALAHGYSGFLGKSLAGPELAEALTHVHAGVRVVRPTPCPETAVELPVRAVRWQECDVGLTPREVEVVMHVTAGYSNREIAETLHLGINSLKSYIRTAYRKMGVTTRSQAVLWGRSHGLYLPERYVAARGSGPVRVGEVPASLR
jgi:two-component system, NarL family, response regulator LiaR